MPLVRHKRECISCFFQLNCVPPGSRKPGFCESFCCIRGSEATDEDRYYIIKNLILRFMETRESKYLKSDQNYPELIVFIESITNVIE